MLAPLLLVALAGSAHADLHCTGSCQNGADNPFIEEVMNVKRAMWNECEGCDGARAAITGEKTECVDGFAGEFPCRNVDLMAFVSIADLGSTPEGLANDLWHWTDPLTSREYVLTCQRDGASYVDITDPVNPLVLGYLPSNLEANWTTTTRWRDVKVYNNYAFTVADGGPHGMQVFDLTRLRDLHVNYEGIQTFEPDALYMEFGNAHNIEIDTDSGFAFVVGSNTCRGGLHMVDIRDPLNPTFAGCAEGEGYTHDAQCLTYFGPDTRFTGREICFGFNIDKVTIYDVTIKETPYILSSKPYPGAEYIHQGWVTDDLTRMLMDDELAQYYPYGERDSDNYTETVIWNIESLTDPFAFALYLSPAKSIAHNIYLKGQYSYNANYASGMRINDISRISEGVLCEAAYFDVRPEADDIVFFGTWSAVPFYDSGVVAASSKERGLFILKPNLPEFPNGELCLPEVPRVPEPEPVPEPDCDDFVVAQGTMLELLNSFNEKFDAIDEKLSELTEGESPSRGGGGGGGRKSRRGSGGGHGYGL